MGYVSAIQIPKDFDIEPLVDEVMEEILDNSIEEGHDYRGEPVKRDDVKVLVKKILNSPFTDYSYDSGRVCSAGRVITSKGELFIKGDEIDGSTEVIVNLTQIQKGA